MAIAIHATTMAIVEGDLESKLGAEFHDWKAQGVGQIGEWLINPPGLALLNEYPATHCEVVGGAVVLRAQAERDALDLPSRKAEALAAAESEYIAAGEAGVTIDTTDLPSIGREVRMRYVPEALTNYQEVATLITLAGSALPGVVLWDADGVELQCTVADAGALLGRYAAAAAQAKVAYMQRKAAINAAESIDVLEAM